MTQSFLCLGFFPRLRLVGDGFLVGQDTKGRSGRVALQRGYETRASSRSPKPEQNTFLESILKCTRGLFIPIKRFLFLVAVLVASGTTPTERLIREGCEIPLYVRGMRLHGVLCRPNITALKKYEQMLVLETER